VIVARRALRGVARRMLAPRHRDHRKSMQPTVARMSRSAMRAQKT